MPRNALNQRTAAPEMPAGASAIALVQSSPLPLLVQQELERRILAGEVVVGAKLNEAAIAATLGVSRGPVREAFRALEQAGLVRLEKNRGVFVRLVDAQEADEIYAVRAVLDEWAGRHLAAHASAGQIKALRVLLERMDETVGDGDVAAYYLLNLEFHDRLIAFTGNRKLLATYRRLVNELRLFRRTTLARRGTLALSLREHHRIVERIAARDAAGAGAALLEHVVGSRRRMHRSRRAAPPPTPSFSVVTGRKSR